MKRKKFQLSRNRPSRFFKAIERGDERTFQQLLQNGTDPNRKENGNSALFLAAWRGRTHMVRLVLKAGANPNWRHKRHNASPLQIALECGRFEISRVLVRYGADLEMLTGASTPLAQIATDHGQETFFEELRQLSRKGKLSFCVALLLFRKRMLCLTAERFF